MANDSINTAAIAALQQIQQAIGQLDKTMAAVFPQTLTTATTAIGGAATLPSNPVGFLSVKNPVTGATVKIPYYT